MLIGACDPMLRPMPILSLIELAYVAKLGSGIDVTISCGWTQVSTKLVTYLTGGYIGWAPPLDLFTRNFRAWERRSSFFLSCSAANKPPYHLSNLALPGPSQQQQQQQ